MKIETRIKLGQLKCDGTCAFAHIITRTDATEHIFVILECPGCDGKGFCRKVARLVEKELNIGG